MNRLLSVLVIVFTGAFVAAGSIHLESSKPATPEGVVHALYARAQARDWTGAFAYVALEDISESDFAADLGGRDGSLRAYSALERVNTSILRQNENEALVRVNLRYSSAVGAREDTRDLKVVRAGPEWKVVWPLQKAAEPPPQVIAVNFLRWDVLYRGERDDWGAQDVAPPRVRITSMNAIEHQGSTVVLGEIVNEDTVPGFIAVNATLLGKDNATLGEETAFDKIAHTLLPKEVSPFRIDFPGVRLSEVKNVRMTPNSLLVPASADPVIAVDHQRIAANARGQQQLMGELVNQSGQTVNIAQALATFYDNTGKVIWVSDGYEDHALLPTVPQPFSLVIPADVAPRVQNYRVIVNNFEWKQ